MATTETANPSTKAKEQYEKEREVRTKLTEEQAEVMDTSVPTPTQDENDLAKLGVTVENEDPENPEMAPLHEQQARVAEATEDPENPKKKPSGQKARVAEAGGGKASYQTRAAPKLRRRSLRVRRRRRSPDRCPFSRASSGPRRRKTSRASIATAPGICRSPAAGCPIPGAPAGIFGSSATARSPARRRRWCEACVSRYAQTIAMCPGSHWRHKSERRPRARRQFGAEPHPAQAERVSDDLRLPSNATRSLYLDGNAYALALRNDRFEISELHLMNPRQCSPRIAETGDVFYSLSGNEIVDRRFADAGGLLNGVPSRDVLHIRLDTPMHPLKGETPLTAAALDIAASNAISSQQLAFYLNQARPSYILSTDQILTKEQTQDLRARWDEQSQGLNQGKTPIMAAGLKPLPLSGTARDAQLAEIMKMSEQRIALVYQIPMAILGIGGGSQTYASTEILMQQWVASGLGFALNHIEEAFGILFGLKGQPDEYLEFDTEVLLRSAFKDRVEGFARGVISGVFAPDEARAAFELPESPGGHGKEARVQSQVVPLSRQRNAAAPAPPAALPRRPRRE